jgi:dihydrodipicolinate synthase/N-acetylneuraminate lyase
VALGAVGCVSGLANAVPEFAVRIFEALKAGESDQANALSDRMKRIGSLISRVEFPLNVAAAIAARGRVTGHPKSLVSPDTRKRCEELAADLKRLYDQWDLK